MVMGGGRRHGSLLRGRAAKRVMGFIMIIFSPVWDRERERIVKSKLAERQMREERERESRTVRNNTVWYCRNHKRTSRAFVAFEFDTVC